MDTENIQQRLKQAGLKITPQRLAVFDVLVNTNHPTADQIAKKVRKQHPGIATGTIYKILEIFFLKGLIRKVETQYDVTRYDAILERHHHLHDIADRRIEDYFDEDLNQVVMKYLEKKNIPDFKIQDIKIQILGKFSKPTNNEK